jgi:hypothetical protein
VPPVRRTPLIAAVGLGAFLLFLIQPMAARFILPWFGGAPTVWSTCLLFFQIALLAGYTYAHVTRRLSLPRQAALHATLLIVAVLALPIAPSASWKPVDASAPALRILLLLTVTLGPPYVVLAATAPLMQDWFARTHAGAVPYRLYAWSNAGSLLALLAYPLAVEPFLTLQAQARAWSILFVVFCGVCGWTALRVMRVGGVAADAPATAVSPEDARVAAGDVWMWVLLSACGSALLLSATNQLCENLAVVPLLWILPLALYLITFILCFAGAYRRAVWAPLLLAGAAGAGWALRVVEHPLPLQVGTIVLVLLAGCMVCHGELVRLRPHVSRLTFFYLAVAAGGSLGGMSVALAAPALLDRLWEFAIVTVLALLLLLAALYRDPQSRLHRGARPFAWAGLSIAFCTAAAAFAVRPPDDSGTELARTRNFYGILIVAEDAPGAIEPRMRRLLNGRILHGAQFLDAERKKTAPSYYAEGSGVELAIRRHARRIAAQPMRIGAVGLGAGTIAAWGEAGDSMRFFEINPAAETYARRYFTFLSDSRAAVDVAIGDARLSLERELLDGPGHRAYDVLAIDAFTGDAIPVHLLTREAFALYFAAMNPDGVLALHVSNRYLDLMPVVRGLAREIGLEALQIEQEEDAWNAVEASTWMLVTRDGAFVERVRASAEPAEPDTRSLVWTDAFSSVIRVLK